MRKMISSASLAGALLAVSLLAGSAGGRQPVTLPVTYQLPQAGKVSIVLFDGHGRVVRELLHAAQRNQGRNTEHWDGLDEQGKPVEGGKYHWKLLLTQGLKAEYLLTLGTNPTPQWDTWPGNHNGVRSVAVDAEGMYLATTGGEGTILALKQTLDGRRIWSIPHWVEPWKGGQSMGSAGGKLYMLHTNGAIHLFGAADGRHLGKWDVVWDESERKDTTGVMDLDAHGKQIVVSYKNHDVVRWLDVETREVIDEAKVPQPLGVAIDTASPIQPGRRVLVISRGRVVAVSGKQKTPKTIVSGLDEPWRLDVEDKTGDFFVAERGKTSQVKRFSKDGKLLKTYGTPGGRPFVGKFDPGGFNGVVDIAADGQGGFIVCEVTSPRRTARFDRQGKLIRQWFGGQRYSNFAAADPVDPRTVWMQSQWGTVAKIKVDYEKKTWQVETTYLGDPGEVRRHGDQTYLCTSGQMSQGKPKVFWVDEANNKLVQVADLSPYGFGKMCSLGHGFTYLGLKNNKLYRLALRRWDEDGVPIFQDEPEEVGEVPAWEGKLGSREAGPLAEDAKGNMLGVFNGGLNRPAYGVGWWSSTTGGNRVLKWDPAGKLQWAIGRHAPGPHARPGEGKYLWGPVGVVNGCVVVRDVEGPVHVWDGDGLWVGTLLENPDTEAAPPGAYAGCGESFFGSLYVVPADARAAGLSPGEVLFFGSGQNNNPVFRIRGWDQFRRQEGTVTITSGQATRLAAQVEAEMTGVTRIPHIGLGYMNGVKVDGTLDPREWRNATPLEITDGDRVRAKVYFAWEVIVANMNATHGLCVAFDVTTDTPWKSASTPELAFRDGASVEVRLGPGEGARTSSGPGDVRIVAAPVGPRGKTITVELMPQLPPGWGDDRRKPITYESGKGKITYARVAPLRESWVAAKPKPDGSGYVVEMLLPLRPPLQVQPRLRFRFDASIVLADKSGTKSTRRLPWHSRHSDDGRVTDTYTQQLLHPNNWAEAILD